MYAFGCLVFSLLQCRNKNVARVVAKWNKSRRRLLLGKNRTQIGTKLWPPTLNTSYHRGHFALRYEISLTTKWLRTLFSKSSRLLLKLRKSCDTYRSIGRNDAHDFVHVYICTLLHLRDSTHASNNTVVSDENSKVTATTSLQLAYKGSIII